MIFIREIQTLEDTSFIFRTFGFFETSQRQYEQSDAKYGNVSHLISLWLQKLDYASVDNEKFAVLG